MAVLSHDDVDARLGELEGWAREGDALRRELRFQDFLGSVEFVNRVAPVAEEMNHHPDLQISWNRVIVTLTTHSQGGITESDFQLARRIDEVA